MRSLCAAPDGSDTVEGRCALLPVRRARIRRAGRAATWCSRRPARPAAGPAAPRSEICAGVQRAWPRQSAPRPCRSPCRRACATALACVLPRRGMPGRHGGAGRRSLRDGPGAAAPVVSAGRRRPSLHGAGRRPRSGARRARRCAVARRPRASDDAARHAGRPALSGWRPRLPAPSGRRRSGRRSPDRPAGVDRRAVAGADARVRRLQPARCEERSHASRTTS